MRLAQRRTEGRAGFTLVELVVVIAIILALASLLLAAVFKALDVARDAKVKNDISQLSQAVQAFMTQYQVDYIPSRIRLYTAVTQKSAGGNYDTSLTGGVPTNQLEYDSYNYLTRVWPRLAGQTVTNWSPDYPLSGGATFYDLEGEECLTFFLGGIPTVATSNGVPTCNGFATNPADPTSHVSNASATFVAPFYGFTADRLTLGPSQAFFVFADSYEKGQPYLYFSSNRKTNGYNRYYTQLAKSDCASYGVWPYAEGIGPPAHYLNPSTFQIISAGRDGAFGPGTDLTHSPVPTWSAITAPDYGLAFTPPNKPFEDDVSNFHPNFLGVPSGG
jgi:prepilin-type N-terminal cleavage/methylation domain-containing protein